LRHIRDDLGSIVAGIERYDYSDFGDPKVLDLNYTPVSGNTSAIGNPYLFTGRRWDPLARARESDSRTPSDRSLPLAALADGRGSDRSRLMGRTTRVHRDANRANENG